MVQIKLNLFFILLIFTLFLKINCTNINPSDEHQTIDKKINMTTIDECLIIGKSKDTLNQYSIIISSSNNLLKPDSAFIAGFLKRPMFEFKNEYSKNKYGKQLYFPLLQVKEILYLNDTIKKYYKIDFDAINPDYHPLITIYNTHKEILESDFFAYIFFKGGGAQILEKSKNFKIRLFYFDEEVSADDDKIKVYW